LCNSGDLFVLSDDDFYNCFPVTHDGFRLADDFPFDFEGTGSVELAEDSGRQLLPFDPLLCIRAVVVAEGDVGREPNELAVLNVILAGFQREGRFILGDDFQFIDLFVVFRYLFPARAG